MTPALTVDYARAAIEVVAAMARFHGPQPPLEEALLRFHHALAADATLVVERIDPVALACGFGIGTDDMLRDIADPALIAEAIGIMECVVYPDYARAPGRDPMLFAWGARAVAIVPLSRAEEHGAAAILLWKTPQQFPATFSIAIEPAWALLQALFPREHAERALAEARERLSGILETIPQGVVFVDDDGDRAWLNHRAAGLLQLGTGSVCPADVSAAMRRLKARAVNAAAIEEQARRTLVNSRSEIRDWEWDLGEAGGSFSVASRPTGDSGIEGRIWVFEDVTARKRVETALAETSRLMHRIVTTSPNIIYVYDLLSRRNIYVNVQIASVLGYTREQLQAHDDLTRLHHPDDIPRVREHYRQCLFAQEGEVLEVEFRVRHADGGWRWLLCRDSRFQTDEQGLVTQVLGVAVDITRRRQIESELREQEERWQLALDGTNDGIWDWNAVTGDVFYSRRWKEMLGYGDGENPNAAGIWSTLVHPQDLERVRMELDNHLGGRTPHFIAEYRMACRDGSWKWVLARGKAVWDESASGGEGVGRPLRMVGAHADITERKRSEEQVTYHATHDTLTGIPNRREFLARMSAIVEAEGADTAPVTLCVCDLDFFKTVNDTYGHLAGDQVLVAFARSLREGVRSGDMVARMGGDEFYILFPNTTARNAVRGLERIRERWSKMCFHTSEGRGYSVTATFGVSVLARGMDATTLIQNADNALYAAKQRGRNRVGTGQAEESLIS